MSKKKNKKSTLATLQGRQNQGGWGHLLPPPQILVDSKVKPYTQNNLRYWLPPSKFSDLPTEMTLVVAATKKNILHSLKKEVKETWNVTITLGRRLEQGERKITEFLVASQRLASSRNQFLVNVKSRTVDRATIQFWILLAKGHSTYVSIKFPLNKQSENPLVCN